MNLINRLDHASGRPLPVTYAVYLLYAFLAIAVADFVVSQIVFFVSSPRPDALGDLSFNLAMNAVCYLLCFFVATRIAAGENWARWALVGGLVVITLICTLSLPTLLAGDVSRGIGALAQVLVTGVAVALLFQGPANAWFAGGSHG